MTLFQQDSLSLAVALALGAAIGLERELSDKAAGLRTNILICLGSCLFMIVSKNFTGVVGADPTRIAAQIVSGIGFIGVGAIMHEGKNVVGLTTAATIWLVAAVGMACGMTQYRIAAVGTVATLLVQTLFPRFDVWIDELRQRHTFHIISDFDEGGIEAIKTVFREAGVKVLRRKLMKKDGQYYSEWYVSGPRLEQKNVVRKLLQDDNVKELTY